MARRQIAPVVFVLALTVAGFLGARALGGREARRDSERLADVAAAQIRARVAQGASLTEGLRLLMAGAQDGGTASGPFATNASRWLAPADFPAAAWVEQVRASQRAAYERRVGHRIVTRDRDGRLTPAGPRRAYVPATLVSGVAPMVAPGTDVGREPGMSAALARAGTLYDAASTPLTRRADGSAGLFLVRFAPRLTRGVVRPGFVVVFVPDLALRGAATAAPSLRLTVGGASTGAPPDEARVHRSFTAAGQRFDVGLPPVPIAGAAGLLPWIIVAGGLALAVLAAALGFHAARRARAQEELDRIFTLSPDLITVADFEGRFARVNPAVEQVLGYTPEEFVSRPYMEFVHADDREATAAEAVAISEGKTTVTFTNRYIGKDGAARVLEWTTIPVVEDRLMYSVARDITARRRAETDLERLFDEQAALRRVATLVARRVGPESVFRAVAEEAGALPGCDTAGVVRFEPGGTATVLGAHRGGRAPGTSFEPSPGYVVAAVRRTGRAARFDADDPSAAVMPEPVRAEGIRSGLASPIVVDGDLWGTLTVASREQPLPARVAERLADFTELVATAISNTRARAELRRLADEQAALRRVATLVARRAPQREVFHAIAEEILQLLGTSELRMMRYEGDSHAVVVARSGSLPGFPVGSRFDLGGENVGSRVFRTGRPARISDYEHASGAIASAARAIGLRNGVGTPIRVEGRLWGVMITATDRDRPLPADTESRLGEFTELMATTIANTESRLRADQLNEEQAALRRVATLIAEEASPSEVFTKVAEEVATLLGEADCSIVRDEGDGTASAVVIWGTSYSRGYRPGNRSRIDGDGVIPSVLREARPRRIDDYSEVSGPAAEQARERGIRSAVGCPVLVGGRTWGAISVARYDTGSFARDTEARLAQFADLVATAIANADARAKATRLADEQAALRRVATLVAEGTSWAAVLDAVVAEMQALLHCDQVALNRFEAGDEITVLAHRGLDVGRTPVGSRVGIAGKSATATVRRTERPARMESYDDADGPLAELARATGLRSSVSVPIVVEGGLWGVLTASWKSAVPPARDTEDRMIRFGELTGTAIANVEARAEVERLAAEQGSLRRVATLVAREASLDEVFAKVADEVASLLGDADCSLFRDEGDGTARIVALSGRHLRARMRVGTRLPLDGTGLIASVIRDGRPHRDDDTASSTGAIAERGRALGIRSAVGCPIVVRGRLWGAMGAGRYEPHAFAPDTEARIARFAELVATAVGNAETRAELERLADEQAALRRVATLVAEGAAPTAVFDAVAAEMERLLDADQVALSRYEPGEADITIVAHRGLNASQLPAGTRVSWAGDNVTARVRRTEQPARLEHGQDAQGPLAEAARAMGMRVTVGAPIVVDGRLWGVISARWTTAESPPHDTEQRMARFAELLDTAIANADGRDQLMASRARLVTAGDDARRRVVRDLHDGAQQRLVHTVVALKLARRSVRRGDGRAESLIAEALEHAESSTVELRELAHGLLPAVLTRGGLGAGVNAVVTRLDLPVRVDIPRTRLPAEIEASAYFVVAESLTNVVKHAHAGRAEVRAAVDDGVLRVEIDDDGVGGADPWGTGLVGMADRVTALGGRLEIDSPPGAGTRVTVTLPLPAEEPPRPIR